MEGATILVFKTFNFSYTKDYNSKQADSNEVSHAEIKVDNGEGWNFVE